MPQNPKRFVNGVLFHHTNAWKKKRAAYRRANPLCERCKARGAITPGVCVDHIIPVVACERWQLLDDSNLQTLCDACNREKTAEDVERYPHLLSPKRGRKPYRVGVDGLIVRSH